MAKSGLFKNIRSVKEDDYDDDDLYDDDELDDDYDDEDDEPVRKKSKKSLFGRKKDDDYDEDDEYDDYDDRGSYKSRSASSGVTAVKPHSVTGAEVSMIMPKSFNDANTIADVLLSHRAVVLNLEGIDISAAQRIIDFASGSCYTVGGSLQKISKKIFIIVPQDMNLSGDFDELLGDMIDLNNVNITK